MSTDIQGRLKTVDAEHELGLVCTTCTNMTLLGLVPGDQRGKSRFLVLRILVISAVLRTMNQVEAGEEGWCRCD